MSDQPSSPRERLTDDEIQAWADRHDIAASLMDLRCMVEDALSLRSEIAQTNAAAQDEPESAQVRADASGIPASAAPSKRGYLGSTADGGIDDADRYSDKQDHLDIALDNLARAFGNDWTPEQGDAMDAVADAARSAMATVPDLRSMSWARLKELEVRIENEIAYRLLGDPLAPVETRSASSGQEGK